MDYWATKSFAQSMYQNPFSAVQMRIFDLFQMMYRVPAISQLRSLLYDLQSPNTAVRQLAVTLIGKMGAPGIAGLVSALAMHQPTEVRAAAAQCLGANAVHANAAIPALTQCLNDPNEVVRYQARCALTKIGGPAGEHLRSALASGDPKTVSGAATILSRIGGPESSKAVDTIKDLTSSSSAATQAGLRAALIQMKADPNSAAKMQDLMNSPDAAVRRETMQVVAEMSPVHSPEMIPGLMLRLKDKDPLVRASAAGALANLAPNSPESVKAVANMMQDPDPRVRSRACNALSSMGPGGAAALDAISRAQSGPKSAAASYSDNFVQAARYRIRNFGQHLEQKVADKAATT
jgi:HEAT repeat protein